MARPEKKPRRQPPAGMKQIRLWVLEPKARFHVQMGQGLMENVWNPWNHPLSNRRMVVREYTEEQARLAAQRYAGAEARGIDGDKVWLRSEYSSCVEATKYGVIGVIYIDQGQAPYHAYASSQDASTSQSTKKKGAFVEKTVTPPPTDLEQPDEDGDERPDGGASPTWHRPFG